jgi:hypothetical protein
MQPFHLRWGSALAVVLSICSACGGSSSPPSATKTPPDLTAFLRLSVASPSSCPPGVKGSTAGRRSPWVGHVDVSVFLADHVDAATRRSLRDALANEPHVAHVYTETRGQAYEEFQRLYTCSAQVPRTALPASYRLVLDHVTTAERDALVRVIYGLPGVGSVSCDPSSPCVGVKPAG